MVTFCSWARKSPGPPAGKPMSPIPGRPPSAPGNDGRPPSPPGNDGRPPVGISVRFANGLTNGLNCGAELMAVGIDILTWLYD